MSQFGLFLTLDIDTILAIQAKAVEMILEGKTLLEWSGEGTEAKKAFTMPPLAVLEECLYALRSKDPTTYGHNNTFVKPFFC